MIDKYRERISYKGRLLEAADAADWSCYCDKEGVDFRKYSPAGEDFGFYVRGLTGDEIMKEIREYAENFDVEDHAIMWIEAKINRTVEGIPDIKTLINDADEIEKMLDELVEILEEVPETIPVVLVEIDYKGKYERYALTPEEFERDFNGCLMNDMPEPTVDGDTYTIRPLVHVWYMVTEVGSEEWNKFFTDMSFELPESDIENKNFAFVKVDSMQSLRQYLPESVDADLNVKGDDE